VIGAIEHDAHQMIPVIEWKVVDQGAKMLEECAPRRQRVANGAIGRNDQVQRGANQKGQQDQGCREIRQIFLAMAEVVFEGVALGFERIVVLGSNLPPRLVCGG
jgi:hypothetical protein